MIYLKRTAFLLLLVIFASGCGTDGLNVENETLYFSNTGDLSDADYVQAGQQYSFTVNIANGTAATSQLTSFTENGNWLNAELINNGAAIQLSGTPSSSQAYESYVFYLTGADANGALATTSFSIYVDGE